jgi:subtilisin family serine protease
MAAKKTKARKGASKRARVTRKLAGAAKKSSSVRRPTDAATRRRKRLTALKRAAAVGKESKPQGPGAATIVYIHGIGNKPPASVLKEQWDEALFEFDLGEKSRMAYWVDRERYPVPSEDVSLGGDYADATDEAPKGEFSAKATRANWDPKGEIESVNDEINDILGAPEDALSTKTDENRLRRIAARMLGENNALTDDAKYYEISAQLSGKKGAEVRRIQAQRYGAAAVRATVFGFLPRPLRQWMTRKVTRMFLRDVNDLFVDKAKGETMRESLRERLRAGGGPFVVIAHSQGTMIAYNVLMEEEFAKLEIPLFVTVGSPLGIDEVQDFIKDLTKLKKLVVPPSVLRWINVCDPLDPVALDKDISDDFAPNALGTKIENHQRFNPDSPRHPHSATGYLTLEEVRQPVRETVDTALFQPVSRFKMAKDVVRSFADSGSGERHRILVQLEDYATTEMTRESALKTIYTALGAGDGDPDSTMLEPEEMQRYVALSLTRQEAETLASIAHGDRKFPVARIWKNSAKWAYIDKSIHTTQAFPAHNSYRAAGEGITWAVLDSGIHLTHPHFGDSTIDKIYDCTNPAQRRHRGGLQALDPANPNDAKAIADRYGHGAHVAGIIAGQHTTKDKDGNERVMSGMAPEAKLVIYKVLDDNGSGEDSWIIKAIDHIFDTNERAGKVVIHGVNLSLGGEFDVETFNCGHTPLCEELRRLWYQGVVVVLAAGNEGFAKLNTSDGENIQANMGMSIGDPGNLDEAIVVGSVHKENPHTYGMSFFSSRGPTADGRMKPDCVAPGERIFSVRNDAQVKARASFEQLYTEMSGTSMAAPHVSGLIASFLSKRKEFIGRPDDVKEILLSNCTDLKRQRHMQGAGLPNLVKMLVNV